MAPKILPHRMTPPPEFGLNRPRPTNRGRPITWTQVLVKPGRQQGRFHPKGLGVCDTTRLFSVEPFLHPRELCRPGRPMADLAKRIVKQIQRLD
jgi:hypothetical protein